MTADIVATARRGRALNGLRPWSAQRTFSAILLTAVVTAVLALALPEDPYVRFQQLDRTEYRNLSWIYARTHFDPRPVDIAILGSSRIASGIDARALAAALRMSGAGPTVENFGIPFDGRNLDLEIARELFATKRPRLLVIGVMERPSRHSHVAFKYVASTAGVIDSIRFGNIDYASDFVFLPYRHLATFAEAHFPAAGNGSKPDHLPTHDNEAEMDFVREPGGHWAVHYPQRSTAAIEAGARRSRQGRDTLSRHKSIASWSGEQRNLRAVVDLARRHDARIVFLFIPQAGSDGIIANEAFYRANGRFLDAGFLSIHPEYYSSWGHLNERGTRVVSEWLGDQLSAHPAIRPAARTNEAGITP